MENKKGLKLCEKVGKCGGCNIHVTSYEEQSENKVKKVKELCKQQLNKNIKINDIIKMQNPYNYRNKGKYVFAENKLKQVSMGFFEEGTHKVVYVNNCMIQDEEINEIASYVFKLVKEYNIKPYNEDKQKGFLRHLIVRKAIYTQEVMVILVTTNEKIQKREEIIRKLISKFKNIKTIVQNINSDKTKVILGTKNYNLFGNGYITDYIDNLKFKISPLSFYQVNPIQTQILYNKAIELAKLTGKEVVYDLYSGIGTISLIASKHAKKVYGIEVVKDAVKDSIENAKINKIKNVNFMAGRVEYILPRICSNETADVVFVDPPRSGLDEKTIQTLLKIKAKKIVYISCNPVTLFENLKELSKYYSIKEIQPVDMFPWTEHVECVSVLQLKQEM